jgi:hypothetical protein
VRIPDIDINHVEKVLVNSVALQKPVSRAKTAFGSSAEPAFPQPRRAALNRVLCTKQMKVRIECIHSSYHHHGIKYGAHMWLKRDMMCLHDQNKAENASKTPVGEHLQAT